MRGERGAPPVLLVLSGARILGGAELSLLGLLTRLPRHGWDVVLTTSPGPLASRAAERDVTVLSAPWRQVRPISVKTSADKRYSAGATAVAIGNTVVNGLRLTRMARTLRATAVLSNSLPTHLTVALAGRLAPRLLTAWYLREIVDAGRGTSVLERAGRSVDLLFSISDAVTGAVRHPRIVKVPQAIEVPASLPPRQAAGPRPRIGYLGRLDPQKGIEDLCEVAGLVDGDFLVAGAPLVAPPGYVDELQRLAESRAPGRVHFCGEVTDPWSFLAGLDVLLVPSRREPWGRVAAEAQVMGVPVIAADAGGLTEIVTDGVDGFLYPPGRIDVLSDRLRRLLEDDEMRERISDNARLTARRLDPDADAEVVASALDEIVDQRARGATP